MKARAKHTVKLIFLSMFVACFIILNSGCGLDEYYVVNGPYSIYCPLYSDQNPLTFEHRYIEFSTDKNDKSQGAFTIDGTDVYYKIYSNYSTCSSEYSALNTLLNNSSSKASSASSLINSYKFQKLKNTHSSGDTFVSHDGDTKRIRIRLTQYSETQDADEYKALIKVDGIPVGIPIRYYGNRFFDFRRDSNTFNAPLPRTTLYEDDVSTNTTVSSNGLWYVNLYAVTRGHDSSFTTYYSPICHLGTLCIDAVSINYDN